MMKLLSLTMNRSRRSFLWTSRAISVDLSTAKPSEHRKVIMKLLWFDTETTGLDPVKHDVFQIAGKVVIDGVEQESFDLRCQPHDFASVDNEALEINKVTIEDLKTYSEPSVMYAALMEIFVKYIDKFDRNDKFVPCGQNVKFDINFMSEFWKKCGDDYFFSFFGSAPLDTMQLAVMLEIKQNRKIFSSYKLEVIYKTLFGRDFDGAHDAMADIIATAEAGRELWSRLFNPRKDT
jgi:DNA polymerase-3 subunit epsilon